MKEDKRLKDWQNDPDSILNTNSTKMQPQEEEESQRLFNLRSVLTVAIVVVALIGLIVGGIFVSDTVYEKKLWETEKTAIRDGAETRYIAEDDLPQLTDDKVDYGLAAMYYTKENGMWMHIMVCNGLDAEITVKEIGVKLLNAKKQEVIADGVSAFADVEESACVVAAGETKQFEVYFPPEYVKIADDTLKEITPEVTLVYQDETTATK